MNNEKENSTQSQPKQRLMYSEAMEMLRAGLASRNLLTTQQSTKSQQTKQDHTIEVIFLKRSKNLYQKEKI